MITVVLLGRGQKREGGHGGAGSGRGRRCRHKGIPHHFCPCDGTLFHTNILTVLWIRIRIQWCPRIPIGIRIRNPDRDQEGKITHKNKKNVNKFHF
jgi:hypothetical protein